MEDTLESLADSVCGRFGEHVRRAPSRVGELTLEVAPEHLVPVATGLRDEFGFEMLMDLCAVDYLSYGVSEWKGQRATSTGFNRGVRRAVPEKSTGPFAGRFAVVCHLLSISRNRRLRLRAVCADDDAQVMPSLVEVWPSANWYEREAFDLFGILFDGHPDLRRLLTDYGFIGHPFRKDFPLSGHVEVRYDPVRGRVAYEPVSIEPRTLVPKVIREDHRYEADIHGVGAFRDVPAAESTQDEGN
jgi:NADH-quinone oxidoreductase subunit C